MMVEAPLGIDADFRMNLQTAYNKGNVQKDSSFMERIANIRRIAAVF